MSTTAGRAAPLRALFASKAPADPDAVLLELPGAPPLTYGEAERISAQLANVLAAHGVAPGDRVAAKMDKSPLSLLLYLACVRMGAVLLPMNPSYTRNETEYLLEDATPALVVCDLSALDTLAGGYGGVVMTSEGPGSLGALAEDASAHFAEVPGDGHSPVILLYTSGTTGRPKGALLSQANLCSNAEALCAAWGFRSDDVLVHSLPMFHIHGLLVATNCVLASGASMIYLPRFEVAPVIEALGRASVFMGVPTYYTRLLASEALDRARCASMRLFVSGSAPLLASTHVEFRARTGHEILERYGMTETSMITSNPLSGERRPGTVGAPLPGVEVRISSADGQLDAGAVGGVEVRGPNVFAGYWRRPELAEATFTADGFFRTGDLGRLSADGYLELVGRDKDLVISGGLNVYPKEVEDVLDAIEGVEESAVIGVPAADLGEAVVAVVVARPGALLDEARVREQLRTSLAGYKVPKAVVFVVSLPRNTMGKVEKAVLRAEHAHLLAGEGSARR